MQPDAEARVPVALAELGDALIALAHEFAPASAAGPIELLSPAEFARRAGLGRSTVLPSPVVVEGD